jgi:hypothetical protein
MYTPHHTTPHHTTILLFLILMVFKLNAQISEPNLIRPINSGEITLTSSESLTLNYHLSASTTSSVTPVYIGHVPNYFANGALPLIIPDATALTFSGTPEMSNSLANPGNIWAGMIADTGYYLIRDDIGMKSGFIQAGSKSWMIVPLRPNYSLLVKQASNVIEAAACLTPPSAGGTVLTELDLCDEEYNTCSAVIDVLCFVTEPASRFIGKCPGCVDGYMQAGEFVTNWAFERSDIPNKRVRFRTVEHTPGYISKIDILQVLKDFKSDPFVNSTMATLRADIAILVTNENFMDGDAGVYGVASSVVPGMDARHCIAEAPFFFGPRWTVPHELSHLLGARHNRSENVPCNNSCGDDTNICTHGWRFGATGTDRFTIHARTDNVMFGAPGTRILNFSNPDVNFEGSATGTIDNNNARAIRNSGCLAAGYAPSPEFQVAIDGNAYMCNVQGQNINPLYNAQIQPSLPGFEGVGPFTIEWWYNTTGVFTYQSPDVYLGSFLQLQLTAPPFECPYFFLHLKVTSADNIVRTVTKIVHTASCQECSQPRSFDQAGIYRTQISPNPTTGEIMIMFDLEAQKHLKIDLFNAQGEKISTLADDQFAPGAHTLGSNLHPYPAGFYWIRIQSDEVHTQIPVILQK